MATALSLEAAGFDILIFEQTSTIEALGVGINLQPNAVRELIELGLGEDLKSVAIETSSLGYYNRLGQLIWSEPRGRAAGYDWPQYSVNRGDLHMMLLGTARKRVGADRIFAGHKFVSFEQTVQNITANFIDSSTGKPLPSYEGDFLVGADGIHSAVRAQLYPDEGPPVSSGRIQWRGVVEANPFLDGRSHVTIGSRNCRAVIYPISEKARRQGRSLINWVTVLGHQQASGQPGIWDRRASKERFFSHFQNWNFDWIPFADLVTATTEIFEYPKDDRDPLPRWSFGRATLLGDAAHPMRPVGSQAGSQAIIDSRVLALALATASSIEEGLAAYERDRLPAMNAIILKNREFGPSIIMDMAEERAPNGFSNIDDVIPRQELEEISRSFKVAAGFEPESLNRRSSFAVRRT
jgi:2-polyprenyl-6-methoxyphenol hydroxylase-like FAD-dependent oxidoreductase